MMHVVNKAVAGILISLLLVAVSGCSLSSGFISTESPQQGGGTATVHPATLPAVISRFLTNAAPDASLVAQSSPWGDNAEIRAHAPYYAASGHTCRQLSIGEPQQKALVCQQPDGSWTPSRIFN